MTIPIVRAGCQRMLKQAFGAEIIEASTCQEGCRLALQRAPDMVVLDLSLPGASGLEALDMLRVQNGRLRVLVFSMHHNPVFAARAIESCARGYLVKSAPPEELLAAVREILSGGIYLSPELAKEIALVALCDEADPLKNLSVVSLNPAPVRQRR